MSLKDKIMNMVSTHPKLLTLGIGVAITFVIGTSIGLVDHEAFAAIGMASHSSQGPP